MLLSFRSEFFLVLKGFLSGRWQDEYFEGWIMIFTFYVNDMSLTWQCPHFFVDELFRNTRSSTATILVLQYQALFVDVSMGLSAYESVLIRCFSHDLRAFWLSINPDPFNFNHRWQKFDGEFFSIGKYAVIFMYDISKRTFTSLFQSVVWNQILCVIWYCWRVSVKLSWFVNTHKLGIKQGLFSR